MRYQVPQFIEVEDKIFGPFTFKQFVYMAGGAGICFIAYRAVPLFWAILIMLPAGGFAAALAFYRPNNRPFINTIESAFNYLITQKLYIWRKIDKKVEQKSAVEILEAVKSSISVPKLSESRLKDLAWSLDINETVYSRQSGKLQGRTDAQSKKTF
ncbi:MAG: PrgI family protein [Candidatus Pacebacteria bacterium]|nr:PrgI family protein [Candidatus Paceibacterota bacterium]MBP9818399.1 PrgI family protein [Candidatus Paceibacterota bacterium]